MNNIESIYNIYVPPRAFPRCVRIDNKLTGETNATNMPTISTNDPVSLSLGNGELFNGRVQDLLLAVGYTQDDIDKSIQESEDFMQELDKLHNKPKVEIKPIVLTDEERIEGEKLLKERSQEIARIFGLKLEE